MKNIVKVNVKDMQGISSVTQDTDHVSEHKRYERKDKKQKTTPSPTIVTRYVVVSTVGRLGECDTSLQVISFLV